MTDSEKLALIDTMIANFCEWVPADRTDKGADALVAAIASVINFEGKGGTDG